MPLRIPKACRVRGCRNTTTDPSGYCESHKSEGWKQYKPGQSRHQRGYGSKWDVIRARVLKRDKGLCQLPYDTVYSVEKNEDRRTAERFQKWVEMGVLTVTDGAEVDYRYILEEAKAANKISPVSESPIDPFGATGLSHDLADEDLNPITIIQNYTNMSDPMKELEAARAQGRIGGRRPKLTPEQWAQAGRLIASGVPRQKVAIIYDVGVSTLYKKFPVGDK